MATVSLSAITAVMNLIYQEIMNNQIRRDVTLPNLLRVRTVGIDEQANSTDTWSAKFSNRSAGGAYAEGADMSDSDYDSHTRKQATHSWAEYRAGVKVSGLAQALSAMNAGIPIDLFSDEMRDAIDYLASVLSTNTYDGTVGASPAELDGLASAIDSTGTYAGLARGTYAEWASAEDTLAAASLSLSNLRSKLHQAVYDLCGKYPDIVVCDSTRFSAVGDLFGSERRYLDTIVNAYGDEVSLPKIRGGFRAIEVDGIPYVMDRHATSATFYALNYDSVEYVQVPPAAPAAMANEVVAAAKMLTGESLAVDPLVAKFAQGARRLQPYIKAIAPTGDAFKAMVYWYGQIRVRYPNRCGKLTLT
jgi:hypothetical protein